MITAGGPHPFKARFEQASQEIIMEGTFRPTSAEDMTDIAALIVRSIATVEGVLYLNARRCTHINSIAFLSLATAILTGRRTKPHLKIVIVASSVVAWVTRMFENLAAAQENIAVRVYDSAFYPGQTFVEDESFIPILRTQTKMTWKHERAILSRHGLRPGLLVADICCGIGDFAVLVSKEFDPSRIVALDHSVASLAYARRVAVEFGIKNVEYTYGDASQTLFPDNQFDFVTCRHSLQIFDRPDLLLKELFRICKPGGRVYITNEKNSHCLGEPRSESIQWTYTEVAKLFAHFGMDVEMGPKSRRILSDAGFDDVMMENFMVTNLDGDPQDFADIIVAWEQVYAGSMSLRRGDSVEFTERFRKGFADHIFAALHAKGYAGWPIWAASGRKPS